MEGKDAGKQKKTAPPAVRRAGPDLRKKVPRLKKVKPGRSRKS